MYNVQKGAIANFDNQSHRQIWWSNVDNNIYILILICINWTWMVTYLQDYQIWWTKNLNSVILLCKSNDQESPLFAGLSVVASHRWQHTAKWACVAAYYRQVSNIRCTKSQNLNVSRLVVQLSLSNPLKPGVKSRMKMSLEQRRQAMLQLHLSDQQINGL